MMDPDAKEGGPLEEAGGAGAESGPRDGSVECGAASPFRWLRRLSRELHWSFVLAVFAVYGACQGVGNAVGVVAASYYSKDVLRLQPSAAQFYQGIVDSPWVVKPVWGLLTDVVPVAGYRRRPYFLLAGVIGATSMLIISLQSNLGLIPAVLALTAQSAGAAIADVTLDALVAQNSITHPPLAADMQSLCGFCSSFGSLIGYSISGLLVHSMGAQGAIGLLSIPSALVFSAGILLKESRVTNFDYKQVHKKFYKAIQSMGTTLKCPEVWRPCLYIYVSLNLSLDIQGGMFYWYTDRLTGPGFSELNNVNSNSTNKLLKMACQFAQIFQNSSLNQILTLYRVAYGKNLDGCAIVGAVGSLLGVVLYQSALKDYDFRSMLLWGQVLSSLTGMLDLALVTRVNTKMGIPDYVFAVIDCGVSVMVGKLQWMPVLVLCSKLCPPGIEGTFYALLMSIQNVGLLMSAWWGGLLLHTLNVTRSEFTNLWAVVLIRNVSRLLPLTLLFLVPQSDQNSTLLPAEMLHDDDSTEAVKDGSGSVQFSVLVADDSSCHPSIQDVQDERIKVTDDVGGDVELIPLMNKNRTVG
ncbi:putative folate-biopterin transporter 2 [Hordeum vulgare]|nr:putative folate-biopterin transporter 2 [Hordeum vulgare]